MNKELESLEAVHTHTGSLKEKGVTLVALVVTIVVLLILAGVTINLVVGQNGLISRAKEAANATNKAGLKEKIDMALTDYEIERLTNSNITFKEYVENNKEQIGIGDFKIIDENPSEDVQFIGSLDGKIIVMKTDGSYVLTKSENLVKNGFGDNGTENFPDFENNNGIFSINTSEKNGIFSSELIPVDINKKYYESIIMKASSEESLMFVGFVEYDVDKNAIQATNYLYNPESLTYLERDLNDGDTEVYLHDISGFRMENLNIGHNDGFIFWNYTDSKGYQYPELTYSRNLSWGSFSGKENFDVKNNKVILDKPWNFGKMKKGTKVSQKSDGQTYNYGVINGENVEKNFKIYDCKTSGIKELGTANPYKFCSATKYVKIWFGLNYSDVPNVTTEIKDIIFAECE